MSISPASLVKLTDTLFAPEGTLGYLLLLTANRAINLAVTVDLLKSTLIASAPHGLVTGSRIVLTTTGNYPGGVGPSEYFVIVTSVTKLKLAATAIDARDANAIIFTSSGDGWLSLTEQPLTQNDPIEVVVNKELPLTTGYSRIPISNVGAATTDGSTARKPDTIVTLVNPTASPLVYRHIAFVLGLGPISGSTNGAYARFLNLQLNDTTLPPYETQNFRLILGLNT